MSELLLAHPVAPDKLLELRQGDLTEEAVDAIVNAANSQLLHGGGVAGLIARKAGPELEAECQAWINRFGLVTHDKPAYTTGGNLPCQYVIHAVGPSWGSGKETERLTAAVQGSLRRAEELGLASLAMPAISTGIFGFPVKRAARIILTAAVEHMKSAPETSLKLVRIVLYNADAVQAFQHSYAELFGAPTP